MRPLIPSSSFLPPSSIPIPLHSSTTTSGRDSTGDMKPAHALFSEEKAAAAGDAPSATVLSSISSECDTPSTYVVGVTVENVACAEYS